MNAFKQQLRHSLHNGRSPANNRLKRKPGENAKDKRQRAASSAVAALWGPKK